MKKIFIAMMAMAAFAACATEDTLVAPKGEAITFGNAFIDNATKAIDGTYTNIAGDANELKAFNVYGTVKNTESVVANIFNGLEVAKQNGAWVYDEAYTQYWVANNTYNFAAVVNGTVGQNDYGMPVTIAYDATQAADGTQDDLLYAEVLGVNYANNVQPVKFTFNHLLSKMKVTVKNQMQNGNGNSYKVRGVKVLDATKTATYDVVNKAWGAYDDVHNVHNVTFGDIVSVGANSVEDAKKLEMGDTGESNYERLFIPEESAALKISIDVEYYVQNKVANADGTHTDVLNNSYNKVLDATHTFVAGRAYNFVITLGNPGEPITFAVEDITDWVEEDVAVNPVAVATAEQLVAALAEGKNVVLAEDVTLAEGVILEEKDVIVDLADKTLSYTGDDVLFRVYNGNLTINGTTGKVYTNATTPGSGGNGYVVYAKDGGVATINGGVYEVDDTCTIAYVNAGGTVYVNGGTFKVNDTTWVDANGNAQYLLNSSDTPWREGTAKIVVSGGSFYKFNPANNVAETAGTNFVAPGYKVVEENDWYTVVVE